MNDSESFKSSHPTYSQANVGELRRGRRSITYGTAILFGMVLGVLVVWYEASLAGAASPDILAHNFDQVERNSGKTTNLDPRARFDVEQLNQAVRENQIISSTSADSSSSQFPNKVPPLEKIILKYRGSQPTIEDVPAFKSRFAGKVAGITPKNEFVFFTISPELQDYVTKIVAQAKAEHVVVIAMEPTSGKVLAIAGKSPLIDNLPFHAEFPAASLFKVITAAAAIEKESIDENSIVKFRGGDYTLTRANYSPNAKSDRRMMTVGEAMGKSCNPVFGRIALQFLSTGILRTYVNQFGFNKELGADISLPPSYAIIPEDSYEFSRTGAGFGDVMLSPLHAASIISGVANDGLLLKPQFIDKVIGPTGKVMWL